MKWCWNNDNHHRRLLRLCLESTEQWTEWFQLFFSVCYYQISILFIRRQKESDKEGVEEHVEGKKTIEMCAFDVKWHNALSKPISIQRCSFFWCWKFIDSGILSWYASKNFCSSFYGSSFDTKSINDHMNIPEDIHSTAYTQSTKRTLLLGV